MFSVLSADQELVRVFVETEGYSFYWPTPKRPLGRILSDVNRAVATPAHPHIVRMYLAFGDGSHVEQTMPLPLSPIRVRTACRNRALVFIRVDAPTVRIAVDIPDQSDSQPLFAMQATHPLNAAIWRLVPTLFATSSALPTADARAVALELRSQLAPLLRQHVGSPAGTASP